MRPFSTSKVSVIRPYYVEGICHPSLLRRRYLVILRKDRSKLGLCSGQPDTFSSEEVEKIEDKETASSPLLSN
jgi:hypothetical protein